MPAHRVVTLQERDPRPLLPAQASPLSLGSKQWHERDTVVALSSSVTSSGMEMNQPCSLLSSAEMDRDTQDSWPAASPNTLCSVNYFYTTFQKPLGTAALSSQTAIMGFVYGTKCGRETTSRHCQRIYTPSRGFQSYHQLSRCSLKPRPQYYP